MGKTVFIFGAGTSKSAGAPVMSDFLTKAREILKNETPGSKKKNIFKTVMDAISDLEGVYTKSNLDLENIEEVFSAVEMARMINRFPNRATQAEIDEISNNLKMLILMTLQDTIGFPYNNQNDLFAPDDYRAFVEKVLIKYFNARVDTGIHAKNVSLITLNYDFALDFALQSGGVPFSYCLEPDDPGSPKKFTPLLKLHGSLNWHKCTNEGCDAVIPFPPKITDLANSGFVVTSIHADKHTQNKGKIPIPLYLYMEEAAKEWECITCKTKSISSVPFIVPPTWNKADDQRTISPVWQRAAQELSEAESIFIVGYSLPTSDVFFKYLFAVATMSKEVIERLWVVNPDKSSETKQRFQDLIGNRVKSKFSYKEMDFSSFATGFEMLMNS